VAPQAGLEPFLNNYINQYISYIIMSK